MVKPLWTTHSCDLADHRPLRRRALTESFPCLQVQSAGCIPLAQQDAETLTDDDLIAGSSRRQFAANPGNTRFGRQHIDARQFHHLGDGAARCHADTAPRRPVDDDAARTRPGRAEARRDLAQQIVGRAVVRLSSVTEASGNRAKRYRRSQRHVADRAQQIEPTVALHVEHQIEFARLLVRQEVTALDAGSMQQHVDAPAALDAPG